MKWHKGHGINKMRAIEGSGDSLAFRLPILYRPVYMPTSLHVDIVMLSISSIWAFWIWKILLNQLCIAVFV